MRPLVDDAGREDKCKIGQEEEEGEIVLEAHAFRDELDEDAGNRDRGEDPGGKHDV